MWLTLQEGEGKGIRKYKSRIDKVMASKQQTGNVKADIRFTAVMSEAKGKWTIGIGEARLSVCDLTR